jgi:hypothetical protein
MALLFVLFRAQAQVAIALIVFPRLFRYARNVLARSYAMPHITTARAKELGPVRVALRFDQAVDPLEPRTLSFELTRLWQARNLG